MKTFFITGGEGFIGYHISNELLKDKDNKVVTYDALKHYIPSNQSSWWYYQKYRTDTLNDERLTRVRGDLINRGLLQEAIEKYKPEVIIHLAGLPIANISHTYPEDATNDLFLSTVNLLDVVRSSNHNVERIVYTSSSMAYGDFKKGLEGKVMPAKEDQECDPKCIYGSMKLCGEIITKTYHKRFGIPYVIIRPSAVYGPTDCNQRVTEIFAVNALTGKELVLDNGGEHSLDFSYVKDTAHGFVLAATSPNALGQTFNITAGDGRTIKEMAHILARLVPDAKIVAKPANVYRPNRGTLDISKAKDLLGYVPQYNLERGMEEYVDFIKSTLLKDGFIKKI